MSLSPRALPVPIRSAQIPGSFRLRTPRQLIASAGPLVRSSLGSAAAMLLAEQLGRVILARFGAASMAPAPTVRPLADARQTLRTVVTEYVVFERVRRVR